MDNSKCRNCKYGFRAEGKIDCCIYIDRMGKRPEFADENMEVCLSYEYMLPKDRKKYWNDVMHKQEMRRMQYYDRQYSVTDMERKFWQV